MKNIHVLKMDKPSRLHYSKVEYDERTTYKLILNKELSKCNDGLLSGQRNIYITSDENIRKNDWIISTGKLIKSSKSYCSNNEYGKKVILTTDEDLIKDGVQVIDDEFLQWFVKNPSCEEVEVVYGLFNPSGRQLDPMNTNQNQSQSIWKYKIIIPDEQSNYNMKQEILSEMKKQETLEEAAEESYKFQQDPLSPDEYEHKEHVRIFKKGGALQAERMYKSAEDFINWLDEQEIPMRDGTWRLYINDKMNYFTTKQLFGYFKTL